MTDNTSVPTLEDVARAAGVSTATVSRCLNEKDKVSAKTAHRVMAAVEALGYTPNYTARAMAARRSYTIGAIIPTMENAIFARGVQAFQEALHDRGYTLLVSSSAYRPELEAEQIRALVARGVDGLLLIGSSRDKGAYDFLEARRVPFVQAWAMDNDPTKTCVGFDNYASMGGLAQKVIDLGHQRIAVISGITEGNDRAMSRFEGIKDKVLDAGLTLPPSHVIEAPYDLESGAAAFESLMCLTPRPTAVMCGNDVLAIGALSKARALGLDVPGDVSVSGFDDIEMARHTAPPLTTVHVPHREMGHRAADVLLGLIDDTQQERANTVKLRTDVVLRRSLGPPPEGE